MSEAARHMHHSADYIREPTPQSTKLSRRMRPPDLDLKASNMEEKSPALRGDKFVKAGRRESRLAFGRLFGRSRGMTDTDTIREGAEARKPEPGTETIGGLPYNLQPKDTPPEMQLVTVKEDEAALKPKLSGLRSPPFSPVRLPTSGPGARRRGSLAPAASWETTPLFQAWPQAMRNTTLPACVQADYLLKMHKKETAASPASQDIQKRSSLSFKLDWTKKIYMFITTGYLLQYAGDGPHDALPEKVVQLTKDSAAFASDLIPGRHWVLQVSSVFEDVTASGPENRSLLGKLGLREKEKRQASNCLMVFESAADMESWMSLLRKEIEVLGGKAPLTEIGTPKSEDEQTLVETSPLSPTSARREMLAAQELSQAVQRASLTSFEGPELHLDAPLDFTLDNVDDNSATNSFVSHDGQQLDNLRDSSNRFSFMSASRTIVTSDSSACNSPIRDSFGSGSQASHAYEDIHSLSDEARDIRLRPNAAEIEDRRQSYRTSNIFLEYNGQHVGHRQHSSLSAVQDTPNFSLPHVVARRRAASQSGTDATQAQLPATASNRPPRRPRRPPPPTLGFTRPLSVVADSPSPAPSQPSAPNSDDSLSQAPDSPSIFSGWIAEIARPEYNLSSKASDAALSRTSLQVPRNIPRKSASTNSLRPADSSLWVDAPQIETPLCSTVHQSSLSLESRPLDVVAEVPRSMSSLDNYPSPMSPPPRSRSPIQRAMAAQKRASMCSLSSHPGSLRGGFAQQGALSDCQEEAVRFRTVSPPPPSSSLRRESLSARRHSRNGSTGSTDSFLANRRSMPQMPQPRTQILPLPPLAAPPPNKALPPIPTGRPRRREGSVPPRIGMGIGGAF